MSELEMTRLNPADREKAFGQMMQSADKALPFIDATQRINRLGQRPPPGPSRGVAAFNRAKGRYVPAKRPAGVRRKHT
jgi:hypothetical protein